MNDPALREPAADPSSRKRFLTMMGGAGAAGALSLALAACGGDDEDSGPGSPTGLSSGPSASGAGDLEIVNYALTLEYIESDFYAKVIASGVITDPVALELIKHIHRAEQQHVRALRAAARKLGGPLVEKPKTTFQDILAGGVQLVIDTAATVENLGAAAYLGQVGNIKDKEILAAALSIHSVEARHAAALNKLAGRAYTGGGPLEGSIPDGPFATPLSMDQVLRQVKPFIA